MAMHQALQGTYMARIYFHVIVFAIWDSILVASFSGDSFAALLLIQINMGIDAAMYS
jgi:hypothetical protein